MSLLQVKESRSKFLFATKTQTTNAILQDSAAMTFPASCLHHGTRDHVAWWKQSAELRSSPSETKRSDQNMGAPDRIPFDPAISKHDRTVGFAGKAFWNTPLLPEP
jgi:hypothetical protein